MATLLVPLLLLPQVAGIRTRGSEHAVRPFVATQYLAELDPAETTGVVASGDLDLDGAPDLVLGELFPGQIFPRGMRSYLNDGTGGFALGATLALDVASGSGFRLATRVELVDVTGDGVLDLLYDRNDASQVVGPPGVLMHPGNGDGSFGEAELLGHGGHLVSFVTGDADGDGTADVLLVALDDLSTLQARWWTHGAAGFLPVSVGLDVGSLGLSRIASVDLKGDGLADLVATTFPLFDRLLTFETTPAGLALTGDVSLPAPYHDPNVALRTGDLDGDGLVDVVLTRLETSPANPLASHHVLPLYNDGSGTLDGVSRSYPQENVLYPPGEPADWDADGDLDLVSGLFSWFENVGGAFELRGGVPNADVSVSVDGPRAFVADYDGDGHVDALSAWGLVPGDSTFPARVSQSLQEPLSTVSRSGAFRDWEGDGDLDFVEPKVLNLNNGDGSFERHASSLPQGGASTVENLVPVGWADYDGDGLDELLVRVSDQDPPFTFLGMRLYDRELDGSWAIRPGVPVQVEIGPHPLTLGLRPSSDADGDGDLDLLGAGGFWANDGTGVFDDVKTAGYAGLALDAFDLDGDGDEELLVRRLNELRLLWNQGGGTFTVSSLEPFDAAVSWTPVDVEEDGRLDLVTTVPGASVLRIHPRTGPSTFGAPVSLPLPLALGVRAAVSDVDGDGLGDLLTQRGRESGNGELVSVFRRLGGLVFEPRVDWVTLSGSSTLFDVDADGDVDALGETVFRNLRFDGAAAGGAVQYELSGGTPGTGGLAPVLGTPGPARGGLEVPLFVGRGLGGTRGWLLLGLGHGDPVQALPGVHLDVITGVVRITLDGDPLVPGSGSRVTNLELPVELAGTTLDVVALLRDPAAANGFSASNGLELEVGAPGGGAAGPRTRVQR